MEIEFSDQVSELEAEESKTCSKGWRRFVADVLSCFTLVGVTLRRVFTWRRNAPPPVVDTFELEDENIDTVSIDSSFNIRALEDSYPALHDFRETEFKPNNNGRKPNPARGNASRKNPTKDRVCKLDGKYATISTEADPNPAKIDVRDRGEPNTNQKEEIPKREDGSLPDVSKDQRSPTLPFEVVASQYAFLIHMHENRQTETENESDAKLEMRKETKMPTDDNDQRPENLERNLDQNLSTDPAVNKNIIESNVSVQDSENVTKVQTQNQKEEKTNKEIEAKNKDSSKASIVVNHPSSAKPESNAVSNSKPKNSAAPPKSVDTLIGPPTSNLQSNQNTAQKKANKEASEDNPTSSSSQTSKSNEKEERTIDESQTKTKEVSSSQPKTEAVPGASSNQQPNPEEETKGEAKTKNKASKASSSQPKADAGPGTSSNPRQKPKEKAKGESKPQAEAKPSASSSRQPPAEARPDTIEMRFKMDPNIMPRMGDGIRVMQMKMFQQLACLEQFQQDQAAEQGQPPGPMYPFNPRWLLENQEEFYAIDATMEYPSEEEVFSEDEMSPHTSKVEDAESYEDDFTSEDEEGAEEEEDDDTEDVDTEDGDTADVDTEDGHTEADDDSDGDEEGSSSGTSGSSSDEQYSTSDDNTSKSEGSCGDNTESEQYDNKSEGSCGDNTESEQYDSTSRSEGSCEDNIEAEPYDDTSKSEGSCGDNTESEQYDSTSRSEGSFEGDIEAEPYDNTSKSEGSCVDSMDAGQYDNTSKYEESFEDNTDAEQYDNTSKSEGSFEGNMEAEPCHIDNPSSTHEECTCGRLSDTDQSEENAGYAPKVIVAQPWDYEEDVDVEDKEDQNGASDTLKEGTSLNNEVVEEKLKEIQKCWKRVGKASPRGAIADRRSISPGLLAQETLQKEKEVRIQRSYEFDPDNPVILRVASGQKVYHLKLKSSTVCSLEFDAFVPHQESLRTVDASKSPSRTQSPHYDRGCEEDCFQFGQGLNHLAYRYMRVLIKIHGKRLSIPIEREKDREMVRHFIRNPRSSSLTDPSGLGQFILDRAIAILEERPQWRFCGKHSNEQLRHHKWFSQCNVSTEKETKTQDAESNEGEGRVSDEQDPKAESLDQKSGEQAEVQPPRPKRVPLPDEEMQEPEPFTDDLFAERTEQLLAERAERERTAKAAQQHSSKSGHHVRRTFADKFTFIEPKYLCPNPSKRQSNERKFNIGFIPKNEKWIQVDVDADTVKEPLRREDLMEASAYPIQLENFVIGAYRMDECVAVQKATKGHWEGLGAKPKVKTRGVPNKHLEKHHFGEDLENMETEEVEDTNEEETVFGNPEINEALEKKPVFVRDVTAELDMRHIEEKPCKVLQKRKAEPITPAKNKNRKKRHRTTSGANTGASANLTETLFDFSHSRPNQANKR